LKELALLIQVYRQNVLFIPETRFHREVSRTIQSRLNRKAGNEKSLYVNQEENASDAGSQMSFQCSLDGLPELQTPSMIRESIIAILPDHHSWEGCVFQFNDSDFPNMMEQLILSGYLDCSVPDALYTIACKIQRRPFGQTALQLVIGYVYDIM
jgi:hypothetical protein